jgi:hypothetical protein
VTELLEHFGGDGKESASIAGARKERAARGTGSFIVTEKDSKLTRLKLEYKIL